MSNQNQITPRKSATGGAMPDIQPDVQDVYGYAVPGTDVVVFRGDLDEGQWSTTLLTHHFHRMSVDYFRYSVDGGKRLEAYLAQKEKLQEAAEKAPAPRNPIERMKREAVHKEATLYVPHEKLRHMHYPHLRKIAKAMGELTTGTKDEVIERILRAQTGGKTVPLAPDPELTEA